jgi:acetyltransferase-like isoleucine patch superfamily enzyme
MRDKILHLIFKMGFSLRAGWIDVVCRQLRKSVIYFKAGWVTARFATCGAGFYLEAPYTIRGHQYIHIGNNFQSYSGLRLEAYDSYNGTRFTPEICIGDNVAFNFDCHIGCIHRVVIGNNVLMASKIFITDHFHGEVNAAVLDTPPAKRELYAKGAVIIEDNVWIGEGVVIMPGVTIGKNSIVGANAVVTKSFPENAVIAGNPAQLLRLIK